MKRNEIKALSQKTVTELDKELLQLNHDLANMRLQKKVAKLSSVSKLKNLSDDIARIKTVLTEKKLGVSKKSI
jgi:large subunit ribosomal protein L29